MVIAVGLFLLGWCVAITAHATGIKRFTLLGLIDQAVGSVLYVALLLRAAHSARTARAEIEHLAGTMAASTAATLRTVDLQIQNARVAAYAIPLVILMGAWLSLAKYWAGEFPGRGVVWGLVFATGLGAMIGGAIWHRYRTVLSPRRRELRETLRAMGEAPPFL
jgi:hypothetical protein